MRNRSSGVVAGALLALAPGYAAAQQFAVVSGVVRDSAAARPLAGATLALVGNGYQRTTQSDETGAFQFVGAKPGGYVLVARRLGYEPWRTAIEVNAEGARIVVSLLRVAALDTVRVRPGMAIFGAIGDYATLRPLRNVEVQVVGSGARVRTDSAGRFFVPLSKPGSYVVRARLAGFDAQTVSAAVPKDDAVELSILLDAATVEASSKYELAWAEFGDRVRMRGSRSALVSRSELMRNGNVSALEALQRAPSVLEKNLRFGANVCVFLDGLPSVITPIWKLDTSAIEAIEVYTSQPQSDPTHTLARKSRGFECHSTGLTVSAAPSSETIQWVVIWTRK